jgi:hypothetical protein
MSVQKRDILPPSVVGPSTGHGASYNVPQTDPWTGERNTPSGSPLASEFPPVSPQVVTLGEVGAPVATNEGIVDSEAQYGTLGGGRLSEAVSAHKAASARACGAVPDGDSAYGRVLGAPGLDNSLSTKGYNGSDTPANDSDTGKVLG